MKNKMYWGLSILIVLPIGISVVMLTRTTDTKPKVVVNDVSEEQLDDIGTKIQSHIKSSQKPPDELGYKWVRHGDHWDKVKIDEQQNETVSTEIAASDYKWTIEDAKKIRESRLKRLPEQIENTKNVIESFEESYETISISYQQNPDSELIKQLYDRTKERLEYWRGYLSRQQEYLEGLSKPDGLEYLISRLRLEEELKMEAHSEK